ncbi:hypothetical protein AOC36_05910 [Erysipelothrix larvae]|uniref:PpiC domain-containing protein n=1 Tax=Erysipelothrix larvae TaxID=1514105 RepID=A0A0X8GZZ4_9FIRM|nr:peptidylprolyl isomerase [Erysipelothrix larvae]AMC93532.1 hypothetical protein AOC36_05910 [Erysipelothrix larvae]
MLENIKKNWFVVLVAVALVVVIGSYGVTQIQSVFKGKTVDGKQVVFEIAGTDIFADEYFDMLDESRGDAELFRLFKRQMLSSLETTDEIAADAKKQAESYIQQISASNGQAGLDSLDQWLISQGYAGLDDLATYFEDAAKQDIIIKDYFVANFDSIFKESFETNKPRLVSHILIKMTDPANPTEEEQAKMDEVDKLLAEGKDFGEVALDKSDDTSSAAQSGSIGVVDKNSSLVTEFLDAMLELNEGEVSGWVQTTYGRHLIYVVSTDFKTLLDNSDYFSSLIQSYSTEAAQALWDKAETLTIEWHDETVKSRIQKYLGLESEGE